MQKPHLHTTEVSTTIMSFCSMIDWLALALVNTGWRLVSHRPASSPVDVTIFRLSRAGGDKQWSAPPSFLQLRPVRVTIVQPASLADAIAPLLKQFSEHPSFSLVTTLTLQQWVEDVHNHQGLVTHINAMPKLTQLCLRLSDEGRYFGRSMSSSTLSFVCVHCIHYGCVARMIRMNDGQRRRMKGMISILMCRCLPQPATAYPPSVALASSAW